MTGRRKAILNRSEDETSRELQPLLAEHHCLLFTKIRVADVLPIERSGLSDEEYGYALRSHFDFVVADASDFHGHFAVEYDGPRHQSDRDALARDRLKEDICGRFGFPLLRVEGDFLHQKVGKFRLLPLFIQTWFHGEHFHQSQAEGHLPADELFDPYWSVDSRENGVPVPTFSLADAAFREYRHYHACQIARTPAPVYVEGKDASGRYTVCLGLAYVQGGVLLSTGRFRSVHFGYIPTGDVAEALALINLVEQLPRFAAGSLPALNYERVEQEFARWNFQPWKISRDPEGLPQFSFCSGPST